MSVTIETSLVPAGTPEPVQLVIEGIPSGAPYTVTGIVDGSSWPVPGGVGVGTGGQVVLIDNRGALNAPVRYRVITGGRAWDSAAVTVPYEGGRWVLQSLDGDAALDFVWQANGLPQERVVRAAAFEVPGRARPPMRTAPGGDGGGSLRVRTTRAGSAEMASMLRKGRPVVLRTDGAARDWPAVELLLITDASSALWEAYDPATGGMSTDRVWSLSYILVDDPQPSAVLSAFTWEDFDDAMSTRTWAQFDTLFAGSTWDDLDTYPWTQL